MFPVHSVRSRHGVSLVECLVALVLLALGVLGAAGTVAASWRLARLGDAASLAARRLRSVADSLAVVGARSCALLVSGAEPGPVVRLTWDVVDGGAVREVKLTAIVRTPQGDHADSVTTSVPCA